MKTCTKCHLNKSTEEFSLLQSGSYKSICKGCHSEATKHWIANNKERNRETKRRKNLMDNYGITLEQYAQMLVDQDGVCAICGEDEAASHGMTGTKFNLSVDHCHETGKVRGLLCQSCNRAIGLLKDNPSVLRMAADYLEGA